MFLPSFFFSAGVQVCSEVARQFGDLVSCSCRVHVPKNPKIAMEIGPWMFHCDVRLPEGLYMLCILGKSLVVPYTDLYP